MGERLREIVEEIRRWFREGAEERQAEKQRERFWAELREGEEEAEADAKP